MRPVISGESSSAIDRDHRLVEERQPRLDSPFLDQDPALLMPGAGDEIPVAAALAESAAPLPAVAKAASRSPAAICCSTTGMRR